jgi:hypothetical protein
MIGVSVIAMTWGYKMIIAHGGVKGANPTAVFVSVFGLLPLLLGVILLLVVRYQTRLYSAMTSSGHAVLLRWQCTGDEAKRFIASEAIRLRAPRRATLYFILTLIAAGLWLAYILRKNFDWEWFLEGWAMLAAFISFIYFYWRALNTVELRAAKQRANSEVIIDAEGVLAGTDVFKWRGFNWGLEEATYESGQPDVLNLVFLAGTLPGSATVGTLRTAAFAAGAVSSPGGSTQTQFNVRIPVTASKAEEVRHLLSTTIAQHLFTPAVIP